MSTLLHHSATTARSVLILLTMATAGCGGGSTPAVTSGGALSASSLTANNAASSLPNIQPASVTPASVVAPPTPVGAATPQTMNVSANSAPSTTSSTPSMAQTVTPAVVAVGAATPVNQTAAISAKGKGTQILMLPVYKMSLGRTVPLTASVVDAKGAVITGAQMTWSIANTAIATVDSSGQVTPKHAGFAIATATYKTVQATTVLSVSGPVDIPTRSMHAGTNLGAIAYYGTNFPFCDLMKSGGGWWARNADGSWVQPFPQTSTRGEPLSLAPGQIALSPVAWNDTHYPAGQYTVLWDGDGTVTLPLSNVTIKESAPHRMVIEPNNLTGALFVGIEKTDPQNPVRNVRFLMPGTENTCATQVFNTDYLTRIAPFSVLRTMDWAMTNGSPIVEWADRPHVEDASYTTSRGVPIEVMIDLANTLHADPWFNVPAMASDDYVSKFAALVHERLDPTLRPRIEYSNEMWNWSFPQIQWGIKQSQAQGLALPWGMPSIYHAKRSVEIFKLMAAQFGPDANRLVRILAGQAVWLQFLENGLAYADTAKNIDAIAIAPYFNAASAADVKNVAISRTLTPDQMVDQMFVSIRGDIKNFMALNAALAAKYNVRMMAYEGGLGDQTFAFAEPDQKVMTDLYAAASRHPRMKELYNEYFTIWTDLGGDTLNQFSDVGAWSKFGFWGLLEYVTQAVETSPKYQGVMQFINAHSTPAVFSLTAPH